MFTINLAIVCGTTFCGCYMMLLFLCIPIAPDVSYSTMWCPPVINLFINPINYSYKYYKPQSSYVSCIGVKGDTPYLAKTRQFSRNFARKLTASSSKKPCEGSVTSVMLEEKTFPIQCHLNNSELRSLCGFRQWGWMIALSLALPLGKYLPNVMELQVPLSSCFAMICFTMCI